MNAGISSVRLGSAATIVIRLSAGPAAGGRDAKPAVTSEQHEPRPISALLSHVLARYGITDARLGGEQPRQHDLFA